jgi:hypothetical protein
MVPTIPIESPEYHLFEIVTGLSLFWNGYFNCAMGYIDTYRHLKNAFDLDRNEVNVPGTGLRIFNYNFLSSDPEETLQSGFIEPSFIRENFNFRYPVIVPAGNQKYDRALIYLHGLNERNWFKHLPGACYLAEQTGYPVIMFPLSYHINRGLPDWSNARKMAVLLEERKRKYPGLQESSVLNLALSMRLTEDPRRFYIAGFQSVQDLTGLIRTIRTGNHPIFMANTRVDLIAYSIGCMLLQVLMLSDPGEVLHDSRIVFFAGGGVFSQLNGVSRFIMDNVAHASLQDYYVHGRPFFHFPQNDKPWQHDPHFGHAFGLMIGAGSDDRERHKALSKYQKQILIISLLHDHIIPVEGIRQAWGERFVRSGQFKLVDFPYPYTHENPFPVLNNKLEPEITRAFLHVFGMALDFFSASRESGILHSRNRKDNVKRTALSGLTLDGDPAFVHGNEFLA